jgi:hypothetical protein
MKPTGSGTGLCVEDASRGSSRSIRRPPRQDVFTIRETQLTRIPAIRFRFISLLCTGNYDHTVTGTICKTHPRPCPCGMTGTTLRMPTHPSSLNLEKNKKNHPQGRKCRANHADLQYFPILSEFLMRFRRTILPRKPCGNRQKLRFSPGWDRRWNHPIIRIVVLSVVSGQLSVVRC